MGAMTEAKLAAFAEQTGIKPATGRRGELLEALSKGAFELIKALELERSGIRDGDGHWHGCDVLGAVYQDLNKAWDALMWLDRDEACAAAFDKTFPREEPRF